MKIQFINMEEIKNLGIGILFVGIGIFFVILMIAWILYNIIYST